MRNPRSKYDQVQKNTALIHNSRQQNNNSSLAAVGGSMLHIQSEKVMKNDASDYNIQLTTPQQVRQAPARDYLRRKPGIKYNLNSAARKVQGSQLTASPYRPAKDFVSRNSEITRNGSQI